MLPDPCSWAAQDNPDAPIPPRVGFAGDCRTAKRRELSLVKRWAHTPATTGHDIFERHYRVQHNTPELLVVFLLALWLFGTYVSGGIGALIGLVFLVGRALYAFAYVEDPAKRPTGFMLSFVPTALLLLGGLGGAVMAVF